MTDTAAPAHVGAELLRNNEALREELAELRARHETLALELARVHVGSQTERESLRAALNLLEDAVAARRVAQRENEERRRVEQALRDTNEYKDEILAKLVESEARQNFVLELADRLRALANPVAIMRVAAEMLARHLAVASTQYALVDADGDAVEVVAAFGHGEHESLREGSRFLLSKAALDWAEAMRAGVEMFSEGAEDQSVSRSSCAVPLLKDGKLVAILSSSHPAPRVWTDTERRLVRDVAERTWASAERALVEAALRSSLAAERVARNESDAANRAKDEFLAAVSHELRTPMASILLWSSALRSGAVPLTELARAMDAIFESAESLSRLIEDLLDLSRLTSGRLKLVLSETDVARVIEAAVEMIRPMAVEKNLSFELDLAPAAHRAVVDAGRLKQMLGNLLTNATKFTPVGGRVVIRLRARDEDFEIEVEDNGEGISPEFAPHLFEKFRQADMADTRQHAGLGIGLAVTKQLVELHGGSIHAESGGVGKGALFRIRLPWNEGHASTSPLPSAYAPPEPHLPLVGVRILLVEDDMHTREAMEQMLAQAGAIVTTAGTVAQALAAELDGDIGSDIIVSDIGLPGPQGIELIERIAQECRRRGRRPPAACAVSAHARDVDRKRAIAAGFDIYVTKPITREQLVEAVTDLRDMVHSQRG